MNTVLRGGVYLSAASFLMLSLSVISEQGQGMGKMAIDRTEDQNPSAITRKKGKATPGRRTRKVKNTKVEPQGNALTRPLYMTVDYFSNVRSELNKVAWPSREDTRRLTILCINVTIASALFLGALAVVWSEFMRVGLNPGNAWMLLAVIVAMVGGAFYMIRRGSI